MKESGRKTGYGLSAAFSAAGTAGGLKGRRTKNAVRERADVLYRRASSFVTFRKARMSQGCFMSEK